MHTVDSIREALTQSLSATPTTEARIFPSSFDPHSSSPAFARRLTWHWQSAEDAIRRMRAMGVMMRLPLFLQYEAPLASAAHRAGAFIFVNDTDNMQLGAAALTQAEIGCIATTGGDGEAFGQYLAARDVTAPGWLLVRHAEEETWHVPLSVAGTHAPVTQEVHLFPGLPILVQCEHLATERLPRFHGADDMSMDVVGAGIIIKSSETELFAFSDLFIQDVRNDGMCPCGKPVFARE